MLFETLDTTGHEQILFCHNREAGLKAIIALHDTRLGPALGGVRMRPYPNTESALNDALRLSRTMTYKNAMAGLDLGGGKAVIIGDPRTHKSEVLLRAFGRFVDSLGGRYITSPDVGTDVNDMELIQLETRCVTGIHNVNGGSGDPAPFTAYGALQALMAAMNHRFGHEEVGKLSIAVQGLGHIGMELVKLLRERGAKLYVTDLDSRLVDRAVNDFGAEAVSPDAIHSLNVDVFAPCALEGALNENTVPGLKAAIVCGTANNQLASAEIGAELHARGILYAPDYVVNAGGAMNVSLELSGYHRERAMRLIRSIYHNLDKVFELSRRENLPTQQAADRIAEQRIESISRLKLPHRPLVTPRNAGKELFGR